MPVGIVLGSVQFCILNNTASLVGVAFCFCVYKVVQWVLCCEGQINVVYMVGLIVVSAGESKCYPANERTPAGSCPANFLYCLSSKDVVVREGEREMVACLGNVGQGVSE